MMCGSDEPRPYPVRTFTYHTEQVWANEVQIEMAYKLFIYPSYMLSKYGQGHLNIYLEVHQTVM